MQNQSVIFTFASFSFSYQVDLYSFTAVFEDLKICRCFLKLYTALYEGSHSIYIILLRKYYNNLQIVIYSSDYQ